MPNEVLVWGEAYVRVWLEAVDVEFDEKIQEIKKSNLSFGDKVVKARERVRAMTKEKLEALSPETEIQVKNLEIGIERIEWDEIFGEETESLSRRLVKNLS